MRIYAIGLLLAATAVSRADVILDTLTDPTTNQTYTTGFSGFGLPSNRQTVGDIYATTAGPAQWSVTKVEFVMRVGSAQTFNNIAIELSLTQFTDGSTQTQPWNSFSPIYGVRTFNTGAINQAGTTNYLTTLDLSASPVLIDPAFVLGIQFKFLADNVANQNVTAAFRDYGAAANGGAVAGAASNGVFMDNNGNGVLEYSPTAPTAVNGIVWNRLGAFDTDPGSWPPMPMHASFGLNLNAPAQRVPVPGWM